MTPGYVTPQSARGRDTASEGQALGVGGYRSNPSPNPYPNPNPNSNPNPNPNPNPNHNQVGGYRHWEHKEPFELARERGWRVEAKLRTVGRPSHTLTKRRPATRA